jgi:hypothetical protein
LFVVEAVTTLLVGLEAGDEATTVAVALPGDEVITTVVFDSFVTFKGTLIALGVTVVFDHGVGGVAFDVGGAACDV